MNGSVEKEIVRVLIVEDESLIAILIEKHLQDLGYSITGICSSGEEAISSLEGKPSEVVLMDVQLSGELDGIQTAKTISDKFKIPVIFITSYTDKNTFNKAKLSSPYGFLTKPINKDELRVNIELALYKHQMYKMLEENEEKYRLLFNSTNDLVFVNKLDGDFRIGEFIEVNECLCRLTGYSREDLMNMHFVDILTDNKAVEFKSHIGKYNDANSFLFETEFKTRNEGKLVVEVNSYQFTLKGEEGILSIARNITERRQLEIQLLQSQKMEAIGRLSGSIAHDFNNFLTVVLGNADLMISTIKPSDPNYARINSIKEASERTSRIVKQLLSMSKTEYYDNIELNINVLLEKMYEMLERLVPENIKFSLSLGKDVPSIYVDPSRIEGVVLNLFINALDALKDGGELIITTEKSTEPEVQHPVGQNNIAREYLLLKVADTGEGMPPHVVENIFDPFYTTKKHGTGLGLSTVYGVIHQLRGHLSVISNPGKGTVFSMYIPSSKGICNPPEYSSDNRSNAIIGGTETILVVEDNHTLLEFTADLLKELGYNVLSCDNGDKASEIITKSGSHIDLMLIDAVIPGKTSTEIMDLFKGANAGQKLICMTAYSDSVIEQEGLTEKGITLIKKPFTSSYLAGMIRKMLDK